MVLLDGFNKGGSQVVNGGGHEERVWKARQGTKWRHTRVSQEEDIVDEGEVACGMRWASTLGGEVVGLARV